MDLYVIDCWRSVRGRRRVVNMDMSVIVMNEEMTRLVRVAFYRRWAI